MLMLPLAKWRDWQTWNLNNSRIKVSVLALSVLKCLSYWGIKEILIDISLEFELEARVGNRVFGIICIYKFSLDTNICLLKISFNHGLYMAWGKKILFFISIEK